MLNNKTTKNARLKITLQNLKEGTVGVIEPYHYSETTDQIDKQFHPDYLFFIQGNSDICFSVFENEIEIL